ncbi:MAG: hypothetical protein II920_08205, partial [Clostridia bacterium]|nr:hypothetical protein [Clostridia bacterium]
DATYDEDDTPIAWLAAASILLKRYPVEREYESLLSGAAIVNIEAIRSAIQKSGYARIYKKRHYITNWRRGDVYAYDVRESYLDDAAFSGYTVGFLCADFYAFDGLVPITYIFRTTFTKEELAQNVELIKNALFWRVGNLRELGYQYKVILQTESEEDIPKDRLFYCGNISILPNLKDERILYDKASNVRFNWTDMEKLILKTKVLQE